MSQHTVVRIAAIRQQVTDGLRDAIESGELAPGERLVEAALCTRFDVSRPVVREALRQLEAEGVVHIVPHRGAFVTQLSVADVRNLYEVREALEGMTGALFALHATPPEREDLSRKFARLTSSFAGESLARKVGLKDDFYDALLTGAHNPVLRQMLESIHGRTRLFRGFSLQVEGRAAESLDEMRTILEAAVAGRAQAAREACEVHVRKAGALALAELERRDALISGI